MPGRTSWREPWEERVQDNLPDGTRIEVVNEYRAWIEHDRDHEKPGCPECGAILYDRLTHVYYVIRQDNRQSLQLRDYHLNSGSDMETLRAVRVSEWEGRDVYIRQGKIVVP